MDTFLHRTDDQRGDVLPLVWNTGVEVRVEGLVKVTPAVGVNVGLCLCVVEGHQAFVVVQEHAHFLGRFFEAELDGGAGAGIEAGAFPPADGPVSAVGTHRNGSLPVDGLPGHAEVPVCFVSNLKQT